MKSTATFRGSLSLVPVMLLVACGQPAEPAEPVCEPSPTITPQEKGDGKGGTNGLDSAAYHAISDQIVAAAGVALTDEPVEAPEEGDMFPVSKAIQEAFLNDEPVGNLDDGAEIRRQIFAHAVQCAVPAGLSIVDGERTYPGGGLLTTTGGWLQQGLTTTDTVEDLLTCMVVLLNPDWQGVPVFLSGPSVSRPDDSPPHVEALWAVHVPPAGGRPEYFVWPILDPADVDACAAETADPWGYRVCGSNAKDCGLQVREGLLDAECEDIGVDGDPEKDGLHYECLVTPEMGAPVKKRAIRTALTNLCDVSRLFCAPPPPM